MNEIIQYIDKAQENIFKYNIQEMSDNIANMSIELEKIIINLEDKDRNLLLQIFEYINIALSNKDYLLCADLLEYELKPLMK